MTFQWRCQKCETLVEQTYPIGQAPPLQPCQCGGMGVRVWMDPPMIAVEGGTRENHSLEQKMKEIPMHTPHFNAAFGREMTGREAEIEAKKRGWTPVGNEEVKTPDKIQVDRDRAIEVKRGPSTRY